jgi:hypothetical protein
VPVTMTPGAGSLGLTGPAPARTVSGGGMTEGDIFTASYATLGGNWPNTWDAEEGVKFNSTLLSGTGPSGRNGIQLAQIPNSGTQFNWGHYGTPSGPAAGVSRFLRGRVNFSSSSNWRSDSWQGGGDTYYKNKFVIAGGEGTDRLIMNHEASRDSNNVRWIIQFDGGLGPGQGIEETGETYAEGQWHSWQIEVAWGSSAQAKIKLWLNTDTYASPTLSVTNWAASLGSAPGDWQHGAFSNEGCQTGGVCTYSHADFRVATTFDSNWHGSI